MGIWRVILTTATYKPMNSIQNAGVANIMMQQVIQDIYDN